MLGRLQFSDDQLQQTQRGLSAAGVQMPNFSNVRFDLAKEINEELEEELEPEESEEESVFFSFFKKPSLSKFLC